MPQCKDRLRYRWLGFHLDLTTSARLRSAAAPARRPRSKRRRPRKQDDPRVEAFNLLFALGLVPTKSRMNDPQGLLLNRMHVMDGDCPKSEVIAEKAPELDLSTPPRSVPLTVNNNNNNSEVTTTTIADTTAAKSIPNTTNNNTISSTKDKDVINNFSAATTNHIQQSHQYLPTNIIDKADISSILPDNNVTGNNINESSTVIDEKKKKNNIGFTSGEQKNDIVEKIDKLIKNVDSSEINENSKLVDHDADDNVDSRNNYNNKLVNGNKDDNTNESSDGNFVGGECSRERTDEGNVSSGGEDSSAGIKCGINDEDVEEDMPVDMLVEEEDEGEEEIEEEEGVETDKNMEEDILDENDPEEQQGKSEAVKTDTSGSPKQQVDEDKRTIAEDIVLSLKKEDSRDVVDGSSSAASVNPSSVSGILSSIKVAIKEDPCVTSNSSCNVGNSNSACSEEDDRNSVTSSQSRKRTIGERERGEGGGGVGGGGEGEVDNEGEGENEGEGSSSESEGGSKRQRVVVEAEDERERLVREYVERCTQSVEEMSRNADKLQREIGALGELARAKELEWNSILRLRKLKEEMLERLLRRRRQAMMLADNGLTQDWAADYVKPKMNKSNHNLSHNQLMMVPVVSSSPGNLLPTIPTSVNSRPLLSSPDTTRSVTRMQQRPILPKPLISHSQPNSNISCSNSSSLLDQQNTVIGEGRQGPILDVKSIIADYRSRHPENVPRRGRRMKSPMVSSTRISGSPALMSMANMALCSGAHIRNTSQDCSLVQENSRPSSTDSTRSAHQTELPAPGLSFKDVLVQFAKMSQPPPPTSVPPIKQPPPPPPPYPEVTLHPVPAPQSPPPTHSSLLHGILTKTTATPSSTSTASHRPTTFSPTLARLLTAPERERTAPLMTSQFRPPTSRVSISDLLTSSKKTRNEITITPVSSQSPVKSKDEVVLLDDDEETDSTDRLVIDESADREREGNGSGEVNSEDVPECQGCHQRAALFVCAGCGNQWYCSRECQVTAWEEHCETCSG